MEGIIYNKVLKALKPLLDNQTVREIDLDYGQLEIYETRPKLAFPAILVDVELPNTQSLDYHKSIQRVTARVTLRAAIDIIHESSSITPVLSRAKALERFNINKETFRLMQTFRDDDIDGFDRLSQTQEKRADGYKVTNTIFECIIEDNAESQD